MSFDPIQSPIDALPRKLWPAAQALWEAFVYALDVGVGRWEFAVRRQRLEQLGLTETDLRWLVLRGYVEHAQEVTQRGEDRRQFRRTGELTFCKRTCVVLTESGAEAIGETIRQSPTETRWSRAVGPCQPPADSPAHPVWNAQTRTLSWDRAVVKRFRTPAANQEAILNAFQEEDWPDRIDDPLPPRPEQDGKRRLSDTVKCLNCHQVNPLIRFHGDGTGEGVIWEPANGRPSASPVSRSES